MTIEFELENEETLPTEDVFECPECERVFDTKGGQRRHTTRVHGTSDTSPTAKKSTSVKARTSIATQYENFLMQIGMLVFLFNANDAKAILANAGPAGLAMGQFAEKRPAVKKKLLALFAVNDYSMLIGAHMAMITPIVRNHMAIEKTTENPAEVNAYPTDNVHNIFDDIPVA